VAQNENPRMIQGKLVGAKDRRLAGDAHVKNRGQFTVDTHIGTKR